MTYLPTFRVTTTDGQVFTCETNDKWRVRKWMKVFHPELKIKEIVRL